SPDGGYVEVYRRALVEPLEGHRPAVLRTISEFCRQLARNVHTRAGGAEVVALRHDGRVVEGCGVDTRNESVDLKRDGDELALSDRSSEAALGANGQFVGR